MWKQEVASSASSQVRRADARLLRGRLPPPLLLWHFVELGGGLYYVYRRRLQAAWLLGITQPTQLSRDATEREPQSVR